MRELGAYKKEACGERKKSYLLPPPGRDIIRLCFPTISGGLAAWRLILTHKQTNE